MTSWQVIVRRLKEKNEVAKRLSTEDWEYLLTSKVGIFTQIKNVMKENSHNEIVLPEIGFLQTNITEVRKKIGSQMRYIDWCEKFSEKEDELRADRESTTKKGLECKQDLIKSIGRLAHLYLQKERDFYITKKQTEEVLEMKDKVKQRLNIDPVVRLQVETLLADTKLTLEGFIYQMKLIGTPVTKDWFIIAYQNINDLFRSRKKATMSKNEFKELLKQGGLYVES